MGWPVLIPNDSYVNGIGSILREMMRVVGLETPPQRRRLPAGPATDHRRRFVARACPFRKINQGLGTLRPQPEAHRGNRPQGGGGAVRRDDLDGLRRATARGPISARHLRAGASPLGGAMRPRAVQSDPRRRLQLWLL